MIDFGEAVVPARRPFPTPSATPTRAVPGAGRGRSLNQRIRGLSSDVDLARVRENTSSTPRSKGQLSHSDVLSRYRPSAIATATLSSPSSAASPSGADGASSARISAARRQAAAESAAARTSAARQQQANRNAARTQAARTNAANSAANDAAGAADRATEQRVREAREKAAAGTAQDEATRARIEAARRDKAASNEARTQVARNQYNERVRAARESSATTGGGLVVDGGGTALAGGQVLDAGHDDHYSGGTYSGSYYNNCYWNTWGSCWSLGWCSWWCAPTYCCGLWWHSYWSSGGSWCYPWSFYWYGPFIPNSYSVVYQEVEPEVIYVVIPPEEEGEAVVPAEETIIIPPVQPDPAMERELNRATGYYLTQGDRAFRDGRYGDAAHFYAKALEYSPDSGILYLVLADALFATGDYRYAAFAIRKALELEPELAANVIDKRDFYAASSDFDRQLATLERFVADHVIDDDARLVLAANYLFGGRPAAAVDLFQSPFSENLGKSTAGVLILEAAQAAQYGRSEVVPTGVAPAAGDAPAGAPAAPLKEED